MTTAAECEGELRLVVTADGSSREGLVIRVQNDRC